MPSTEHYYVSKKDNKIRPAKASGQAYFNPNFKSEDFGKAKYLIDVFGYNTMDTALEVRDMIDAKGIGDKIFHIKIETK